MNRELFDELADAADEMKAVMEGQQQPSRVFHLPEVSLANADARFAGVCKDGRPGSPYAA